MAETREARKYSTKAIPILRVGTWNGYDYTEAHLRAILDAYGKLKRAIVPRVTLDHDEAETRRMGGGPALGFVDDLQLSSDGQTLLGTLTGVPYALARAIELKAYGPRSVEVFFDVSFYGELFPAVLTAVTFLGADLPAVDGLEDIDALYAEDDSGEVIEVEAFSSALAAALSAAGATRRTATLSADVAGGDTRTAHQEESMDAIKEALGLDASADEAAVVAAIRQQQEAATGSVPLADVRQALGLGEEADAEAVLAALKAAHAKPEGEGEGEPEGEPAADAELAKLPASVVARLAKAERDASSALATLAKERAERRLDDLIAEGKLIPAQRAAFLSLATDHPKHFDQVVATLKPNGLLGKPKGHADNPDVDPLEPTEGELSLLMASYHGRPNAPTRDEAVAMLKKAKHDERVARSQED